MKTGLKALISAGALGVVALVVAQGGKMMNSVPPGSFNKPTVGSDTVAFHTVLGSFKLLGGGDDPARGNLTFAFRGTVLLTDPKGDLKLTGSVRKEYEDTVHKKVAYFGKGSISLNGSAKSVQFFGSDVNGSFKGAGLIRLYGEFDNKYDTGSYRYGSGQEMPWGTGGINLPVPQMIYNSSPTNVKPRVQDAG